MQEKDESNFISNGTFIYMRSTGCAIHEYPYPSMTGNTFYISMRNVVLSTPYHISRTSVNVILEHDFFIRRACCFWSWKQSISTVVRRLASHCSSLVSLQKCLQLNFRVIGFSLLLLGVTGPNNVVHPVEMKTISRVNIILYIRSIGNLHVTTVAITRENSR